MANLLSGFQLRALAFVLVLVVSPIAVGASIPGGSGSQGAASLQAGTPSPTPTATPGTGTPTATATPTEPTPTPSEELPTVGESSGETVNVTGSVVRAGGGRGGDTVGASSVSIDSPGVDRTNGTGGYSLVLGENSSYDVQYVQGDVRNGTGVMPRDGSPDLFALDNVTTGRTDTHVGETQLPTGYVVDVYVNDTNGDPVEDAMVVFVHRNPATDATAAWGNLTSADGHVYPYQAPASLTDPGLELNGAVQVMVYPPPGYAAEAQMRSLAVGGPTDVTVTFAPPASGNLTVDDPVVADHSVATFAAVNETGIGGNATYVWSFGDGSSARTSAPDNTTTHLYRSPGEYTAGLQVYDNWTEQPYYSDAVNVTVLPAGSADLVADPETANVSENVTFRVENVSLRVDDNVSFYSWNTQGGQAVSPYPSGDNVTLTYPEPGTYTVRVTAYNGSERRLFTVKRNITVEGDGAGGGGGAVAPEDPWPTLGHDAARTSYDPTITGPQTEPGEYWSVRFDHRTSGPAAVVDGVAYVLTSGREFNPDRYVNRLYGLDTTTGAEVLNVSIDARASSSPTVAGDVVYVGTEGGRVLGYSTVDGTETFNVSLLGSPLPVRNPAVAGDTIFATGSSPNASVFAAYWTNGTQRTTVTLQQPAVRAPTVAGDVMYVPVNESFLAINVSRPSFPIAWSTTYAGEVAGSVASVQGGLVYATGVEPPNGSVGTTNGTLYAYSAANGSLVWSRPIEANVDYGYDGDTVTTAPAVVDGTIYVGARELYAFDAATGAERGSWNFTGQLAPGKSDALAATDAGTVYATVDYATVSERAADVVAFRNGQTVWRVQGAGYGFAHPSAENETLILVADRQVLALSTNHPVGPPTASLAVNVSEALTGEPVGLDGSGSADDGSIVEYRWDFDGDGTVDDVTTTDRVVHTYDTPGSYGASLTVVDDQGLTATDTDWFTVREDVEPVRGAWPQFHFDAANTGYNASARGPVAPVEEAWNSSHLAAEPLAPVVWNGSVVSTEGNRVVFFDAGRGNAAWVRYLYPAGHTWDDRFDLTSSPTVVDGVAYVGAFWNDSDGGTAYEIVYALDATTGEELWNVTRPVQWDGFFDDGITVAEPKVVDGKVVVTSAVSDSVFVLDASGGHAELWADDLQARHASQVRAAPAVANGTVFVTQGWSRGGSNGYLYAFDLETGEHRWNATLGYNYDGAAPAVADGVVYVARDGVSTLAFDAATGEQRWSGADSYVGARSSPAVTEELVIVGKGYSAGGATGPGGGVRALDRGTGQLVWEYDSPGVVEGAPAVAGNHVYLGTTNGTVHAVSLVDGSEVWSHELNVVDYDAAPVIVSPAVADDVVYVRSGTNQLVTRAVYAIREAEATGDFRADLVASPATADVNDTQVTLSLANTSGTSPATYTWRFGDGTTVRTTHPTADATHTYGVPGSYVARVAAFDDGGTLVMTDETTVEAVDRVPPVVRASGPASVPTNDTFVVDASNSTDNHRIASYTFAPDTGQPVTTTAPNATLSFATPGNHSVTVTATDASGNANATTLDVFVRDTPDLTVDVTAPATQRLTEGATATLTVTNEGTDDATGVAVRLNATARVSYYRYATGSFDRSVGDLAPGESANVTIDVTDWANGNVGSSRPRVDLVATVDPADTVVEGDETNNVAEVATDVGYSDLVAYVRVPYTTITDEPAEVEVLLYNRGNLPSRPHNATLSFDDGSGNLTLSVPSISPYDRYETTRNRTFTDGRHVVSVNVTDDPLRRYNYDEDTTRTEPFSFRLYGVEAPTTIERGETFYVYATGRSNYDADQNATLELPDGLELTSRYPRIQNETRDDYERYRWEVRAVEESGGTPFQLNVTGRSRTLTDTESDAMSVIPPRIRVQDSGAVAITDDGTRTTTLDVRNETTYEHDLDVRVQLGPQGRTLAGLDYLFDYPNYCVEQTTSPMLAALNTDQYYRTNPAPGGYDRQKVNDSVAIGVDRLTVGDNAQHANGAWSMYGDDPAGDMYYTAYALFGTSSVANDAVQGSRPTVGADLAQADFNATVHWLDANQEPDGRFANDKHYFEDDDAMTGFTLVALERAGPYNASASAAADRLRANATAYLVGSQNADGSWGDSSAMSTALAVWGLARSGVDTPDVDAAIEDGTAWLVADQNGAGAWTEDRSGSWRATGTTSETTGYAVLALNATGVPATNDTVAAGTSFLVATYDRSGSWGYTRASAVAIESLLALGVEGTSPSQDVTVRFGTAANPDMVNRTVTVDDGTPQETDSLTASELGTLRDAGAPIQVTVETTGTGQLVVGIENDQVVNRDEYERNTGGD